MKRMKVIKFNPPALFLVLETCDRIELDHNNCIVCSTTTGPAQYYEMDEEILSMLKTKTPKFIA